MTVRYAVGLPNVGEFGDPGVLVELGVAAERHGWDGVYVNDHVLYHRPEWPVANPTAVLGALAVLTSRVRLGVLVTALPRRRAQVVAREMATLDVLSGGRLVFGAGLGSMDAEYAAFGEDPSLRVRAGKLDDSLAALDTWWSGGTAYGVRMTPTPVQRPRPPVWCAGRWPATAGFRRAARWDGVMPTFVDYGRERPVPPAALAEVTGYLSELRGGLDGFDVALEGTTVPGDSIAPYMEAGLTWWVEAVGWWRGGLAEARARIAAGPPVAI
jgi:alkanesulfonate monooxygenase SsuD/methylene tetrahydromethanopterin reductase-like flavin-dependent oxidoreductase (luciferase family)